MSKKICQIEGCDKLVVARGLCGMHYQRFLKHGDPTIVKKRSICQVENCDKPVEGHGYCSLHYQRWRKHGDPQAKVGKRRTLKEAGGLLVVLKLLDSGRTMKDVSLILGISLDMVVRVCSGRKRICRCEICGIEFTPKIFRYAKYCSRMCSNKRRSRIPCSVEDCKRFQVARGYCSLHYQRWYKHGDPDCVLESVSSRTKDIGEEYVSGGYVKVKTLEGWRLRSQLVFEEAYAVRLRLSDKVIHLNGDKSDDRLENLILRSRSKRILKCGICGSMFVRILSQQIKYQHSYCSRQCRHKAKRGRAGYTVKLSTEQVVFIKRLLLEENTRGYITRQCISRFGGSYLFWYGRVWDINCGQTYSYVVVPRFLTRRTSDEKSTEVAEVC